ncbi:MAG: YraN family protein [Chitinophagaceae bacterium]|nr:YraN family protein [Chitinophagaceae bacterium]
MAIHNQVGKDGENLAAGYLLKKGYEILHRNWRYSFYEIDIIARKNNKLHIIEVKTLNETSAGFPEESVTKKKFKRLLNAADEFLYQHPEYRHVQYDILAITFKNNGEHEYFLIEDVYL